MPMSAELKEIVRCPKCKGKLRLEGDETGLVCEPCKLRYPIVDEIPWLLVEEAKPVA